MAKNHFEMTYLVHTRGLAVEVLVKLNLKYKPFEVSANGFDPQIPGVPFETRPGRQSMTLFAADVKAAVTWLRANAQPVRNRDDHYET